MSEMIWVAVDAMGGDLGPEVLIKGAVWAAREHGVGIILVGLKETIEEALANLDFQGLPIKIAPATQVVEMDEAPSEALRRKKDSSIRVAFELVKKGEAAAVVSAGNSGATLATALFVLGRMEGVERPAIATVFPTLKEPTVLIDAGANVDCKPRHLFQFGLMAAVFAQEVLAYENPRVGLLSIGEEGGKGNQLVKKTFGLFKQSSLNFVGNIEGRDIFRGDVDVVVCDGFVGNICLKLSEGLADAILRMLSREIKASFSSRLGYLLARRAFDNFRRRVDWAEYGGAPLLGVAGVAIICHGRSQEKAIKNAIRNAKEFAERSVPEKLQQSLLNSKDLFLIKSQVG